MSSQFTALSAPPGQGKRKFDELVELESDIPTSNNGCSGGGPMEKPLQEKPQTDNKRQLRNIGFAIFVDNLSGNSRMKKAETEVGPSLDGSSDSLHLPPAPERPLDSDCCGGGCDPCVMDIYEQELQIWKEECNRIKTGQVSEQDEEYVCLCHKKYTRFTIWSIKQEATNIVRIQFSLPAHQSLGLSIGQHLILRLYDDSSSAVTRQYTPTSPLHAKGFFEMMIKIYEHGRASQIIQQLKVGDSIEMRGPSGNLTYKRNKYEKVLLLCAGTGAAPMFQVIHTILADEEDDTRLRLVYASRDYSCLMGREEIGEWRRFWNFSSLFLLSQEPDEPPWRYKHGENVKLGHINLEVITQELGSSCLDSLLVLVCGPRPFDEDVLACLSELGVPEKNVHRF